MQHKNLCCF